MFKKVLFPVIMNEHTEQIINCLGGLAKNGVKEVLLFHVLSISEMMNGKVNRKNDEEILLKWKMILEESGIKVDYKIITGIPWLEIVEISEREKFSFIILGSHGNTFLDKVFLGSVTKNVIHHSNKPVFVYKLKHENTRQEGNFCYDIFHKIFYATDFSKTSEKCIPFIEQMRVDDSQELIILHVQDLRNLKYVESEKIEEFNEVDQERLEKLKSRFQKSGFTKVMTLLTTGYSIPEILNYARTEEPSIIVMGKKGKSNIKEMLLGGVAETVINKSEVPVFIAPENKE